MRSEEDALSLGQARIDDSVLDIRTHNFNDRPRSGDVCNGACEKPLSVFRVYASGKAALFSKTPSEYRSFKQRSMIYERVIPSTPVPIDQELFEDEDEFDYFEDDPPELFKKLVREAAAEGVAVKNCYLCRYHGADGIDAAIFCKLMKEPTPSNSAGECGHYRPVSARELEHIDRKNAEYAERTYLNRTINRMTRGPFGNLF